MGSTTHLTSAVGTGPSSMWQSNTTYVKQTIIFYKHNTAKDYDYIHIIGHLCV